jgi:hypothetical protein
MKKKVVQDVVPPKKSIRNIKLQSRSGLSDINTNSFVSKTRDDDFTRPVNLNKEPIPKVESTSNDLADTMSGIPTYKYEYDEPKKPSKKVFYLVIFLFVFIAGFSVSAFFKSATIRVAPKQENRDLSDTFKATRDGDANTLTFQVVSTSKDVEKTVVATGEQMVEKKASGTIVIYNNTASIQKLVATTRFQTPEGLVYRLVNPVAIPAKTTVNGKSLAGSIEALVEADKIGTSYNIGLKDFTVPGFKGDPKFSLVYARSKTEMTGGFSGMQKVVSKDLLTQAELEMENSLKDQLSKDIASQIPANFILYTQSIVYRFEPAQQVSSTDGGAVLRKKGTANVLIFDRSILSRSILLKIASENAQENIKVANLEQLEFTYSAPGDINTAQTINFTLKGSADLVWFFDENMLKNDLLGLSKNDANSVIRKYSGIKEAWVETYPFWNQTIPKDPKKVTLINTLTK